MIEVQDIYQNAAAAALSSMSILFDRNVFFFFRADVHKRAKE
jgi:hypothetical protein